MKKYEKHIAWHVSLKISYFLLIGLAYIWTGSYLPNYNIPWQKANYNFPETKNKLPPHYFRIAKISKCYDYEYLGGQSQ